MKVVALVRACAARLIQGPPRALAAAALLYVALRQSRMGASLRRFGPRGPLSAAFLLALGLGEVTGAVVLGLLLLTAWAPREERLRDTFQELVSHRNRSRSGTVGLLARVGYSADWVLFCGWSLALNGVARSMETLRAAAVSVYRVAYCHEKLETEVLTTPASHFRGLKDVNVGRRLLKTQDGYSISYVDRGPVDAKLTVVCLHGEPAWSYMYRDVVDALAGRVDPGITSPEADLKAGPGLDAAQPTDADNEAMPSPFYRRGRSLSFKGGSTGSRPEAAGAKAKRWRGRRRPQQGSLKDRVAPNMAPEPNPLLETKFRVILLDFLGCGMSDKPSNERVCSTTMQIRVLADLFAKLQLEKVVLVMHDAASVIGQCCLPSIYHRVDSVVLLHTNLGLPSQPQRIPKRGAGGVARASYAKTCSYMEEEARHFWAGFLRFTGAVQHPSEIVRIWIPEGAMVKPGRARGNAISSFRRKQKQQPVRRAQGGRDASLEAGTEANAGTSEDAEAGSDAGAALKRPAVDPYDMPYPGEAHRLMLRKWQEAIYCPGEEGRRIATQLGRAQAWLRNHYVKPVLALFGDQDLFLDVQDRTAGIKLVNQVFFSSPDVGVHVIQGGGRFLLETHAPAVIRQLRHFTEEQAAQTNPRLRRAAADFHAFSM